MLQLQPRQMEEQSANPTLVMDPSTKLSQSFEISNYNGKIDINNLPSGYVIVDKNETL